MSQKVSYCFIDLSQMVCRFHTKSEQIMMQFKVQFHWAVPHRTLNWLKKLIVAVCYTNCSAIAVKDLYHSLTFSTFRLDHGKYKQSNVTRLVEMSICLVVRCTKCKVDVKDFPGVLWHGDKVLPVALFSVVHYIYQQITEKIENVLPYMNKNHTPLSVFMS